MGDAGRPLQKACADGSQIVLAQPTFTEIGINVEPVQRMHR